VDHTGRVCCVCGSFGPRSPVQSPGDSGRVFFLKAVLLDGAFHAPGADLETGLAELLGDDVDRGVGIEEAVADDLSLDLVGADGIGLRSPFLVLESQGSLLLELLVQLIISLS
jgi:hypothetical protein